MARRPLPAFLSAALLAALAGCAAFARRMEPMEWARDLHARGEFPLDAEQRLYLGRSRALPMKAHFDDAAHGEIDFGDGLVLRVRDPGYAGGWATLALGDLDGDRVADLRFSAVLLPEGQRVNLAFLRRDAAWERYVLPDDL